MQTRMIDNEVKMLRAENLRLSHEREQMVEKIQDNMTKIKQNKVLPYLVSKVVEILDVDAEAQEGAAHNEQNAKKSKCAVIKTSTRQVSSKQRHVIDLRPFSCRLSASFRTTSLHRETLSVSTRTLTWFWTNCRRSTTRE